MSIRVILATLMASVLAACLVTGAAAAPGLVGTSSGEHVWLVVPVADDRQEHSLLHHAESMGGPFVNVQRKLSRMPEALASWGPRLWILFGAPDAGEDAGEADGPQDATPREIFSFQIVFNQTAAAWVSEPKDHFDLVPALPRDGRLAGFVGSARGPRALLVGPDGGVLRLLALDGSSWSEIELPLDLDGRDVAMLAAPVDSAGGLTVLAGLADDPAAAAVLRLRADGSWDRSRLEVDPASIRTIGRAGRRLWIQRRLEPQVYELGLLRPSGILPLTTITPPSELWLTLGLDRGPSIYSLALKPGVRGDRAAYELTTFAVDPASGRIGEPEIVTRQPLAAGQIWQLAFLIALAVTVTLVVLVFRPSSRGTVSLPREIRLVPLGGRLLALAIDLVPGAIVAIIVLDASPLELGGVPLLTPDLADSSAYLLMVAITCVHSAVLECLSRRTLGKLLTGTRVVAQDGSPPPPLRLIVRNLVKLLVLVLPVLGLLIIVNPHLQGVHDMAAGTVVVRDGETAETPAE